MKRAVVFTVTGKSPYNAEELKKFGLGWECARQLTIGEMRQRLADKIILEILKQLMNPREQQLVEALELAKEHLEYTGYGDSWERETARANNLEKKINDALEVAKNGPQFFQSKFDAKWSACWRQKVETLKTLLAEKQAHLESLAERFDAELSKRERLQVKYEQTLDALNTMTDNYHQVAAQRDEARSLHTHVCDVLEKERGSRVTATECQMAFADASALRAEVRRLEKLCKHYLTQRDDWNSKWAALAEKVKTLANES